jgi:hypothetical protein
LCDEIVINVEMLSAFHQEIDFLTRITNQHKNVITNDAILGIFEYSTKTRNAINLKERTSLFEREFV